MVDQNSTIGLLKAFILGCLMGAGAAILLAPQSGKRTRRQIQRRGLALKDQVEEDVAEVRAGVGDVVSRTHHQAEVIQEQGSKALKEQIDRLIDVAENLRQGITKLTPSA